MKRGLTSVEVAIVAMLVGLIISLLGAVFLGQFETSNSSFKTCQNEK